MRKKCNFWVLTALTAMLMLQGGMSATAAKRVYDVTRFGVKPGGKNVSAAMQRLTAKISEECDEGDTIVVQFSPGEYHFHTKGAAQRTYYISNHDQDNPKHVGIALDGLHNLVLEGNGARFIFHGKMLPVSLVHSANCTLKDFSVDFAQPHISQVTIKKNTADGITFEVAPWVDYRINRDTVFEAFGEGWSNTPQIGIAFDGKTRHIVYNTSDLSFSTKGVKRTSTPRTLYAPHWKDSRLLPGTVVAMRSYHRPAPGILLSHNRNTCLSNVTVHYAEGMGLLAQLCEDITLQGFNVCLKGDDDPRYFTTQADATHFSGCKGKIISKDGLYEGMMDDAINVHGTYLKVIRRLNDHQLVGRYMHGQSWGFDWGYEGDEVQFVRSRTMEVVGTENRIASIRPHDKEQTEGAREFLITFRDSLPAEVSEAEGYGIENLTWTPEVLFAGNTVRNNRARGALFSTPRLTVAEDNLFDHTSGTAILLCGDCNGWYETGACREVIIRRNRFVNALTNMFQFTNAVISIYPEIPDLAHQSAYFHGGKPQSIRIEENEFDTFDQPILYAKSVDGLLFRHNTIRQNNEYVPFHWNKHRFLLERVRNVEIEEEVMVK